jgi:hypothetical protein
MSNKKPRIMRGFRLHGRSGSNARHLVLETSALPTELHPSVFLSGCKYKVIIFFAKPLWNKIENNQARLKIKKFKIPCSDQLSNHQRASIQYHATKKYLIFSYCYWKCFHIPGIEPVFCD